MTDNISEQLSDVNSSASPVLVYSLFLTLRGKAVRKPLHTKKRGRIVFLANNREWDRAELIVRYGKDKKSPENGGVYTNIDDFRAALSAFTESELLDYIFGGAR